MDYALFDLDGTLTDPQDGIIRCIQFALRAMGETVAEHESLLRFIGPPLGESFASLLENPSRERIALAISTYRERFSTVGLFENTLYPGIVDSLTEMRDRGIILFVATSKPRVFAERIVEHFSLSPFFRSVFGSELDGTRTAKAELIRYLLETEGIDPASAVMIGDRSHDIEGAKVNSLASVGVTWGFGTRQELASAGAGTIIDAPRDLLRALVPTVGIER